MNQCQTPVNTKEITGCNRIAGEPTTCNAVTVLHRDGRGGPMRYHECCRINLFILQPPVSDAQGRSVEGPRDRLRRGTAARQGPLGNLGNNLGCLCSFLRPAPGRGQCTRHQATEPPWDPAEKQLNIHVETMKIKGMTRVHLDAFMCMWGSTPPRVRPECASTPWKVDQQLGR